MAECVGVRCDRCGERAFCDQRGHFPNGWGHVLLERGQPFLSKSLDLCPACWELTMNDATAKRVTK